MSALILVFSSFNCLYWTLTGLTEKPNPNIIIYGINLVGFIINCTQLIIFMYFFLNENKI